MIPVVYIPYSKRDKTTFYERQWYMKTVPHNLNAVIPGGGIMLKKREWSKEEKDSHYALERIAIDQVVQVAKSARSYYSPSLTLLLLTKFGSQLESQFYDRLFKSAKNKCKKKWGIRYLNKQLNIFIPDLPYSVENKLKICILEYISSCNIPESKTVSQYDDTHKEEQH